MDGTTPRVICYRFGPFELDPVEGSLSRNGIRIRLQDLPYRLLLMLVERPGEIITREEVRQHIWPENTFVEFDNSLAVAIRKVRESLNDNAEAPTYVATLPRRGYRFVASVVVQRQQTPPSEKPPMELPPSPMPPASAARTMPVFQPHWGYWVVAGVVLLLGVAAVSLRFHFKPPYVSSDTNVTAGVRLRRSVAVLGFRNLPGRPEDDWLSPVFSEMLDTELGTRGDLRMVSGEDIARAKRDLPATEGATLSKQTLDHLRTNPGADVVVLGSYTPLPGKDDTRIRLDLRVQDTADGETIAEEAIIGDRDNLFDLAARAGSRLRQRLGLVPNSSGDLSTARLALPADQASARLYVEGREKLWAFDFLGARDLLLKAVAADPQFPLAHSALSEAWWHLGYHTKARDEAQRARALSQDLGQEDRWLIEGQYWRTMYDWPQAVQAYRALFHQFPDSLDYGLLLAAAQMSLQPSAARQTLAALRRLPPPVGDDPRIDMTEASAWIGEDLAKARAFAQTAIQKGRTQGRPVLVERTYGFLCQQNAVIGASMQQALNDCETARQFAVAAGDRSGEATMVTDLAGLHYEQGDLAQAEDLYSAAAREFREVGNAEGLAVAMANLAAARVIEGNLDQARKLLEASIPDYRAIDDQEGLALTLNNLGDLARENGKLDTAERRYQQARTAAEGIESKSAIAYVSNGLGDVYSDRGNLGQARQSYQAALDLRKQIGEKQNALESQVALARLSVEAGQTASTEKDLRQLEEQFHQEQQADDELAASVVLADLLLAQGRQPDARTELERSQALSAKTRNLASRLQYEIVWVRVIIASDHPEQARQPLEKVLQQARAHQLAGIELEAMLEAAILEKRSGHTATAQTQLASLERSARNQGFGLIARKAAAARS
jgi:DNA-binding winged helix-turn-helix (wHTH) protein/tetratricopeptide (TPR) repeat protein